MDSTVLQVLHILSYYENDEISVSFVYSGNVIVLILRCKSKNNNNHLNLCFNKLTDRTSLHHTSSEVRILAGCLVLF